MPLSPLTPTEHRKLFDGLHGLIRGFRMRFTRDPAKAREAEERIHKAIPEFPFSSLTREEHTRLVRSFKGCVQVTQNAPIPQDVVLANTPAALEVCESLLKELIQSEAKFLCSLTPVDDSPYGEYRPPPIIPGSWHNDGNSPTSWIDVESLPDDPVAYLRDRWTNLTIDTVIFRPADKANDSFGWSWNVDDSCWQTNFKERLMSAPPRPGSNDPIGQQVWDRLHEGRSNPKLEKEDPDRVRAWEWDQRRMTEPRRKTSSGAKTVQLTLPKAMDYIYGCLAKIEEGHIGQFMYRDCIFPELRLPKKDPPGGESATEHLRGLVATIGPILIQHPEGRKCIRKFDQVFYSIGTIQRQRAREAIQQLDDLRRAVEAESMIAPNKLQSALDSPAAANEEETYLALVRKAIRSLSNGAKAKPELVIKYIKANRQKVRAALRTLEGLGEYDGFARKTPSRYRSQRSSVPER